MCIHSGRQRGNFVHNLRQRAGIPLSQLADATSERLGHSVEFSLDGGGKSSQPLVVHDEGLNLCLGELPVFRRDLGHQRLLSRLQLRTGFSLILSERQVFPQHFPFVVGVRQWRIDNGQWRIWAGFRFQFSILNSQLLQSLRDRSLCQLVLIVLRVL